VSRRRNVMGNGLVRAFGLLLAVGGLILVLTSLPRWFWLLALGALLLWAGLLLASPHK
jgi:hypothetical protein